MEQNNLGKFSTFTLPSGYTVTIREQNGADDDILSNPSEAQDLTNLSRFVANIVVETDFTKSKKLTLQDAKDLPVLDRYCILFNSRIFSIGADLDFKYDWGKDGGGEVHYTQDLNEFLFDYSQVPTEAEMDAKPDAIPFYPERGKIKDIPFTLDTGKELLFDVLNGHSEAYIVNLPLDKRVKNQELIARNLRLKVNENYEKVTNFSCFSVREMSQIRRIVAATDPIFSGLTTIENPNTGATTKISIIAMPGFFYPEEI